jgi:hypothetical protein
VPPFNTSLLNVNIGDNQDAVHREGFVNNEAEQVVCAVSPQVQEQQVPPEIRGAGLKAVGGVVAVGLRNVAMA